MKVGDTVVLNEGTKPIASLIGTCKLENFVDYVTKNIPTFIINNCMQICYTKYITPILEDEEGRKYRETIWCILKTNSLNWKSDLIKLASEIEIDVYYKNYHELYNHPENLIIDGESNGRTYMTMRK